MAKYDWKQLEKEYILGEHNSVSGFLKDKNINATGNTNKQTKGWAEKKARKEQEKSNEIIEKVTEQEVAKEVKRIDRINNLADTLADKIEQAITELETYIVRNKKKTKTVEYDNEIAKPTKEVIEENETIETMQGSIDRLGLKQLTGALKDIKDITIDKDEGSNQSSLADLIQQAYNGKAGDKQ